MSMWKQFSALFKFQATVNPTIWILPLVFGLPLILPYVTGVYPNGYHPGFFLLLMNQNLIFVGIFGTMIVAPEKFQFGASNLTASYSGNEFILTRAIDRPVFYRAKAALLYAVVLALPVISLVHSLGDPDLVVREYSKNVQQKCLATVPGSVLMTSEYKKVPPSLLAIPRGNVLVAEWQLWMLLAAAVMLQLLIPLLYPYKYGKVAFWAIYFGLILVPLFDLTHLGKDEPTVNEQLFYSMASQQALFWILSAAAFIFTQLWCERRFAQLEQ
jgi:hypothetical protein